jgi:hypothetical protein
MEKQEEAAFEGERAGDDGRRVCTEWKLKLEEPEDKEMRKGRVGPTRISKEENVVVVGIGDGWRSGETVRSSSSLESTRYTFLSAFGWGGWGTHKDDPGRRGSVFPAMQTSGIVKVPGGPPSGDFSHAWYCALNSSSGGSPCFFLS